MSVNISHTDQELLQQVAQGDEQAFRQLYARYWRKLYGTAFKRIGDHQLAKDIIQEIFLSLWSRRNSLEIKHLESYLMIALRNQVLRHLEKEGRYTSLDNVLVELTHSDMADALVLKEQLLKTYHSLLAQLPPAQRQIVVMRFEQDMSTEEIAQQLDISRKTVQNQLRTALITIRSTLVLLLAIGAFKKF